MNRGLCVVINFAVLAGPKMSYVAIRMKLVMRAFYAMRGSVVIAERWERFVAPLNTDMTVEREKRVYIGSSAEQMNVENAVLTEARLAPKSQNVYPSRYIIMVFVCDAARRINLVAMIPRGWTMNARGKILFAIKVFASMNRNIYLNIYFFMV